MLAETIASRLTFSEYRFLFRAVDSIDFPEFTGSLWRGAFGHALWLVLRVSLLHQFYTDAPLQADFSALKYQAAHIRHKANVWSGGWQRYSSRQQRELPVKGWLGDIFLQGENLANFWPYLYLGQWLHTGKSTNMGLGRYELQQVLLET